MRKGNPPVSNPGNTCRAKRNALRSKRWQVIVSGNRVLSMGLVLPDCPEPGVLVSRMIPLAANNCFVAGVPLGRGANGTMKLEISGKADVLAVETDGDTCLPGGVTEGGGVYRDIESVPVRLISSERSKEEVIGHVPSDAELSDVSIQST